MLTRSQRIPHENLRLRDAGYVGGYEDWVAAHAFAQAGVPRPCAVASDSADADAVSRARRRAQEPDRRVADGAIFGAGRRPRRLPPGASGRARDGRGRHGVRRNDVRVAGRADHARLPGPVERCAARRLAPHRRLRPRRDRREDRDAARPRGREGLDLRAVGGRRGSAACRRQLAARVRQRAAVSRRRFADGARGDARRLARIKADFVAATRRAARGGLRLAGAPLRARLSAVAFISPLTNRRDDEYGGDLAGRCRYPLEVFAAIRAVWPEDKPISVRISAHDWADGGITPDDAVAIGRLFKAAGADMMDCSSGPGRARRQAGLRTHVPDAVRRPDPQRGGHRHHRRGRDLRGRPREQHHRRRPRRPLRHCAAASRQSRVDA